MLHIVNRSPFERSSLESCLRMAQPGAALLLIEDGVYAATRGTAIAERVAQAGKSLKVYALGPDVDARALRARLIEGIEIVDYAGFVDLVVGNDNVQSWL